MPFTLHRSERLRDKIIIQQLFEKGSCGFTRFPFRVSWVYSTDYAGRDPQVLFVVSKRNFPAAADRNRIKRQLREAYRTRKTTLAYQANGLCLMIAYIGKTKIASGEMAVSMERSLSVLKNELQKNSPASISSPDKRL